MKERLKSIEREACMFKDCNDGIHGLGTALGAIRTIIRSNKWSNEEKLELCEAWLGTMKAANRLGYYPPSSHPAKINLRKVQDRIFNQ